MAEHNSGTIAGKAGDKHRIILELCKLSLRSSLQIIFPQIKRATLCTHIVEVFSIRFPDWIARALFVLEQLGELLAFNVIHPDLGRIGTIVPFAPPTDTLSGKQYPFAIWRNGSIPAISIEDQFFSRTFMPSDAEMPLRTSPEMNSGAAHKKRLPIRIPVLKPVAGRVVGKLFWLPALSRHNVDLSPTLPCTSEGNLLAIRREVRVTIQSRILS